MQKWKKIVFFAILTLVAVRIVYIGVRGEVDKEYRTSFSYDLSSAEEIPCESLSITFTSDKKTLNSIELFFSHINKDKKGAITLALTKGEDLLYQANLTFGNVNNNEWKKVYVNAQIEQGAEYAILLDANDDCTDIPTVFVTGNAASEISGSYDAEGKSLPGGMVAVNFGYLVKPGIYDCLSMIFLWLLLAVATFFVLLSWEKIIGFLKKVYVRILVSGDISPFALLAILEVFGSLIIINKSGIEFQPQTKIIFYAISLLSVLGYGKKNAFIKSLANSTAKKAMLCFLYAYAAFALVGQRILMYPFTLKLTIASLFVFLVTLLWFVPVMNSMLYCLELLCGQGKGVSKLKLPCFVILCLVILLLPAFLNLVANNPGISNPDAVSVMSNAKHLHGMSDWHPAFYSMVLRIIQTFSDTTYAVIAVQYFFWAYVMLELLLFLRKHGMKDWILICVAVFFGFSASNFIHLNTILKDVPYSLSLFWMMVILARLTFDYEDCKRKWYIYLEFVVAMVGTCLYRKNGVVPFLLILLAVILVLRKNVKAWASCLVAFALVAFIKGPVYQYFEIVDLGTYGIYIGLGNDVLGTYYAGGEVSEDTLEMITMMTAGNNAEYGYKSTWSAAAYDVDVTPDEFVKNYLDTFVKNPVLMTRALIDRQDAVWDIFIGKDANLNGVNFYGTVDGHGYYGKFLGKDWLRYYPARRYVALYPIMAAATDYTANTQWVSAIEWRGGLLTLLGVTAFIFAFLKSGMRKELLISVPIIGQILGLILSTGWSDFRYYWPLNLMNMAAILILVAKRKSTEGP